VRAIDVMGNDRAMKAASHSRRPAFLCALIFLLCALATYPVAEIGMNDDWSYVQSARVLAQTGRIVYNGWATAMLGWQLLLGGLFAKVFGPSFTAIRASTLLVALLTVFLMHRTFVRAGVNSRNATVGTLVLVLGPLFLPLAVSFMSDVGGLLCLVVCLYACLRALQDQNDRAVVAWLAFAALSNALGGTIRQIAWLGVLVMFPCAVWLLRRRPHVLITGALLYVLSLAIVFGSLHWFQRQPNSVPEHIFSGYPNLDQLNHLALQLLSLFLSYALFLLPVIAAFAPHVSLRDRRTAVFLACGILVWVVSAYVVFHHPKDALDLLLAPFKGNYVNSFGIAQVFWLKGKQPFVLPVGVRLLVTVVVLLALLYFFAFVLTSGRTSEHVQVSVHTPQVISWPSLLSLFVPFVFAYVALLLPRGLRWVILDRYLLLLLPIGLILLLRLYQERVSQNLPLLSSALVLLFTIYAVAGTHDAFSRYRAQQSAIDELRGAGVPATSIDGGFEHNAMTQIESAGYIADFNVFIAHPERFGVTSTFPNNCQPALAPLTPVIVPGYTLSFDPMACGGLSRFPPIPYRAWLNHRTLSIYVLNTINPNQKNAGSESVKRAVPYSQRRLPTGGI